MSTIIADLQRCADAHPFGPIAHVVEHVIGRDRLEAAADAPQIFLLPQLYRFESGQWVSEIDSAPLEEANWKRYWWRPEPAMLAELERAAREGC